LARGNAEAQYTDFDGHYNTVGSRQGLRLTHHDTTVGRQQGLHLMQHDTTVTSRQRLHLT